MIGHAFKAHPIWSTRDMCEFVSSDPEDTNAICGAPRSAHMDSERALQIQLSTALRERDEARALANQNALVGARHKDRADAAEEALAAARRQIELLSAALAAAQENK